MKKFIVLLFLISILAPQKLFSSIGFLGLPVPPDARIVKKTDKKIAFDIKLSHDEVVNFYKKALAGQKDIKLRKWTDATYIEDDSNRPWHSITIYKKNSSLLTRVVIMKDNWTWIIGTLVLRFIGVFVVLMVLYLAMTFSNKITEKIVNKTVAKKA